MARTSTYHHGELRQVVMTAALEAIARDGLTTLSLRQLARDAGVSHGAPAHHFGDRKGLFTALATAGCRLLIEELRKALAKAPSDPKARLRTAGVTYVQFAADNPAYFEVMFNPELHRRDDPELQSAFDEAKQLLRDAVSSNARAGKREKTSDLQIDIATLRAWSMAHGLACLWLSGNIVSASDGGDIAALGARIF
jgi:AcrR family transcriptional regulator